MKALRLDDRLVETVYSNIHNLHQHHIVSASTLVLKKMIETVTSDKRSFNVTVRYDCCSKYSKFVAEMP